MGGKRVLRLDYADAWSGISRSFTGGLDAELRERIKSLEGKPQKQHTVYEHGIED